jgi:hypothetical protein
MIHDNNPRPFEKPSERLCTVIPFPSVKRVHKLAYTAQRLAGPGTEKQKARWRDQIFNGIENQFLAVGVSPERAEEERLAFEAAVARQIERWRDAGVFPAEDDGAA